MRKTLLVVVIMALIIGLCAGVASAKSDNGKGLGQAPGQQMKLQQADTQEFTDVQNHWAKWAIKKAQTKGYLEGYGDGTFGPEDVMTKAQAMVLLDKLSPDNEDGDDDADDEDDDADDEDDDADVDDDSDGIPGWAKQSVKKAVYHGYIKRFHSEKQCERAYIFVLYAKMLEDKDLLSELPDDFVNPFADLDDYENLFAGEDYEELDLTPAEIYEYLIRLHLDGIIKGSDGNLNVNSGIKRAEMAVLTGQIDLFIDKHDNDSDDDSDSDSDNDSDSDSDAEEVISELEDGAYSVGGIDFSLNLTYDEDDDTVTAKLYADEDSDAADEWEDLSDSDIEEDVVDICDEIADAFEDDADITLDTIEISLYDEDDASLNSFDYDVSEGELD
ncbi:S-layer homology domain-containing protein [Pelotomaculum propionicicum]|uniref:S-layer homology domain-containing protein n=1 Tax=Pelotomaculum propionicicum TaxID=258475 RepID=UPI003B781917